ncbi:MAG TPA: hypothetical protein VH353_04375 [Caulobacteraceae bacterium]|nr:hypothetical protein [Caulobacteraceae bacterium]
MPGMKPAGKARRPPGEPLDMEAIIVIAIFVIGFAALNFWEFGRVD